MTQQPEASEGGAGTGLEPAPPKKSWPRPTAASPARPGWGRRAWLLFWFVIAVLVAIYLGSVDLTTPTKQRPPSPAPDTQAPLPGAPAAIPGGP